MKSILFSLVFFCSSLFIANLSQANVISIHTDNLTDLHAFEAHNIKDNLSVETNLFALKKQLANIKFEYMTTKRSLALMDETKNICVVNKVKNQARLEKFLFSQPVNLFLSRRLYQTTDKAPLKDHLLKNDGVNLNDIFTHKKRAKLLISSQISYGDALDKQISLIPSNNKLIRHSAEQDSGVLGMFIKKRAEFALLYPHQIFDTSPKVEARSYAISSISPYILGHLMCTKNNVSKAFLKNIDAHLLTQSSLNELLNIHLKNVNPIDKQVVESLFQKALF